MLVIREAKIKDLEEIVEANRSALGYDYPIEKAKVRLEYILANPMNRIFVADLENRVVGYIHGADYDCTYSDSLKNILALAVLLDCQGMGIGKKLVARLEEWAKESGAVGVRLVSGMNREEAHKFYEAVGYSQRKIQKNFIKLFS